MSIRTDFRDAIGPTTRQTATAWRWSNGSVTVEVSNAPDGRQALTITGDHGYGEPTVVYHSHESGILLRVARQAIQRIKGEA